MIIKISVVKIQHPIENHESRPVTSNPAVLLFLGIYTRNITLYKKYYHSQEVLPFTKKVRVIYKPTLTHPSEIEEDANSNKYQETIPPITPPAIAPAFDLRSETIGMNVINIRTSRNIMH